MRRIATLGHPFYLRWRGSSDSLVIRTVAEMDRGWSINAYGVPSWVAEVPPQSMAPSLEARLIDEMREFDVIIDEIKSNMEWGKLLPGRRHVLALDWMLVNFDMSLHRPTWRKQGLCPDCGDKGSWVGLACCCPYHGVFI